MATKLISNSPALDQFVDKLIEEKGLKLEPEILAEIKKDLLGRLEDRLIATTIEHLPPEHLEAFEKILDTGSEEESQEFCQRHIPNLDEVLASAMLGFRASYLGI